MKKERFNGLLKRILLFTLATVLIVSVVGFVAYAEFTKSSRAKRVVASYESSGDLFSSNYLLRHSGEPSDVNNRKTIFTSTVDAPAVSRVTICNYAQGSPAKVCDTDIKYMLTAELVKISNNEKTVVTGADDLAGRTVTLTYKHGTGASQTVRLGAGVGDGGADVYSYTFTPQVLNHETSDSHYCTIQLSSEFLDETGTHYYLYLRATPVDDATPDDASSLAGVTVNNALPIIDSSFDAALSSETRALTWTGKFNEPGALTGSSSYPDPDEYDGFRYVIEGNGIGKFKLMWKDSYLAPSQLFLKSISAGEVLTDPGSTAMTPATVDGESGWKYVEFMVNSDIVSRYDLQLYYQPGATGTFISWDQMVEAVEGDPNSPYIKYEYTEGLPEETPVSP